MQCSMYCYFIPYLLRTENIPFTASLLCDCFHCIPVLMLFLVSVTVTHCTERYSVVVLLANLQSINTILSGLKYQSALFRSVCCLYTKVNSSIKHKATCTKSLNPFVKSSLLI